MADSAIIGEYRKKRRQGWPISAIAAFHDVPDEVVKAVVPFRTHTKHDRQLIRQILVLSKTRSHAAVGRIVDLEASQVRGIVRRYKMNDNRDIVRI